MLPSGSLDADPLRVVLLTGRLSTTSAPALATGGLLPARFTVTVTSSSWVAPLSSVTLRRNTYTPCTRLLNADEAEAGLAMVYWVGPLTLVQAQALMVPSGSLD